MLLIHQLFLLAGLSSSVKKSKILNYEMKLKWQISLITEDQSVPDQNWNKTEVEHVFHHYGNSNHSKCINQIQKGENRG